ncbi:uncharacterized protein UV8b_06230 [Ustilaginoidea virens]|uniref:Uncharacterized protein n=1 Tax=Ustilaginoidea virens TaxID=1159556 RepID=A0A8E5HVI0_USTVR|nr:uncharacterized protein UV8b_06230 [Ustilaginoidea virens]QUC21989.1 hypothetical protein UV8b_06230 [Ustilaginoidea virens]
MSKGWMELARRSLVRLCLPGGGGGGWRLAVGDDSAECANVARKREREETEKSRSRGGNAWMQAPAPAHRAAEHARGGNTGNLNRRKKSSSFERGSKAGSKAGRQAQIRTVQRALDVAVWPRCGPGWLGWWMADVDDDDDDDDDPGWRQRLAGWPWLGMAVRQAQPPVSRGAPSPAEPKPCRAHLPCWALANSVQRSLRQHPQPTARQGKARQGKARQGKFITTRPTQHSRAHDGDACSRLSAGWGFSVPAWCR